MFLEVGAHTCEDGAILLDVEAVVCGEDEGYGGEGQV